jgi:DNA end-binding protein Ku
MPASRPYWNGFLKLSFVSCPIALYPAISAAERVSLREVNRRTGHRLKHKLVDAVTGEAVVASDKARGYQVGEDEFLLVEDRDLEQARSERPPPGAVELVSAPHNESPPTAPDELFDEDAANATHEDEEQVEAMRPVPRPQNTRTVEVESFLPVGQIDARYFDKAYYVVPRGEIAQEAFAVIRDAMTRERVVGLARVVLSSRERPFLVEPVGTGLRGLTLRFKHEVRSEADYFGDIPKMRLPAEMMKLAQHIIRTKSADFDPSMLEDHYRSALLRIIRKKEVKRQVRPTEAKPSRENVVSLMDALRRSIAAERPAKAAPGRRAVKPGPAKRPERARRI